MGPDEFRKKCKGIIPVLFCPYAKDRKSVDLEALRKNTQFLVNFANKGNKDVVIITNGSTAEFYANSIEEQKSVIKTVIDTVDGAIPTIVGVSQAGTKETIKMAKYAEAVGADCVMVVTPYYHTPFKEGLYRHFKAIAESINIGIMVYNNVAVSAANIDPKLTARLSKIDNIVALKDNTPIAKEWFLKTIYVKPEDIALCIGTAEVNYVSAASFGFMYKAFVTSLGNYAPQLSYFVYEAVEKERDFIKAHELLREKIAPIISLIDTFSANRSKISILPSGYGGAYIYQSVGKAAMDLIEELYGGPCRLPMEELTKAEKNELETVLKEIGLI